MRRPIATKKKRFSNISPLMLMIINEKFIRTIYDSERQIIRQCELFIQNHQHNSFEMPHKITKAITRKTNNWYALTKISSNKCEQTKLSKFSLTKKILCMTSFVSLLLFSIMILIVCCSTTTISPSLPLLLCIATCTVKQTLLLIQWIIVCNERTNEPVDMRPNSVARLVCAHKQQKKNESALGNACYFICLNVTDEKAFSVKNPNFKSFAATWTATECRL